MHISTRLILGGSQENTVLSCEGQASPPLNHDVALVYGPIYGPEGSMLERVRSFRAPSNGGQPRPLETIETIETPNLVREISPRRDRQCLGDLKQLISRWKPDVVHTHSSKAGILGRMAAWSLRVPCVVHTVHGPPFHRYEKRWRNAMYVLAERHAAKRCHKIICVADAMRDQFLAAGIGRPGQYVTVYSGMEIEPFLAPAFDRDAVRADLGFAPGDFVLGTVARLAEHKGHDDLLDALSPMMQAHRHVRLLWVGDGWWRERLMQRVRDLDLQSQVVTTGLVPPEMIPKFMLAMDALAHPSYREGLPRAVTQGLLSALPVAAYDVDGTREVCVDRETGLLVRPGDLAALRDAVQWMLEHPAERAAMGRRGREFCRARFDARIMIQRLEDVYRSVLESTR
jgi:glycosyltransferase involved in cell wall biosynthesis